MAIDADLYLEKMDLEKYCGGESCELCHADTFDEFVTRLKKGGQKQGVCPHWPPHRLEAFRIAVKAAEIIPPVPSLEVPRPAATGLLELLPTDDRSPVLVTGSSEFTQAVLLAILSLATAPVKLVSVDTQGHTVDMAMIFQAMTADKVASALSDAGVRPEARIILPGLADTLAPDLEKLLQRPVEVGPVCAAELPLYMGDDWGPPA